MFANTSGATGMCIAPIDVCKVPAPPIPFIPTPFPNIAQTAMAVPTQFKHFIMMMPSHNLSTMIPLTNGDQAGVMGGLISSTIMGPSRCLMGSMKVLIGGLPATKMLSPTLHNAINAPGGQVLAPSQTKVMYMS